MQSRTLTEKVSTHASVHQTTIIWLERTSNAALIVRRGTFAVSIYVMEQKLLHLEQLRLADRGGSIHNSPLQEFCARWLHKYNDEGMEV